jgi:cytochrome c oxidase assembly protein subunit 15
MLAYRRLAFISTIATFILIFVGGLVRVAGAGLGCPDWPKCFGRWIPPLSVHDIPAGIDTISFNVTLAWIEYCNRLMGVTLGFLIVGAAILALVHHRAHKRILYSTLGSALLVAFQGWLGSVVVSTELRPIIITLHMVLALVIASLLIYATLEAYYLARQSVTDTRTAYPAKASRWMLGLWLLAIVQVILGTEVRAGAEIAAKSYPLWSSLKWLGQVGAMYHIHMAVGMIVFGATIWVTYSIFKLSERPTLLVRWCLWSMILLVVFQIVFGIAFMVSGLTALLQLYHLWGASLYIGFALVLISALGKSNEQLVQSSNRVRSTIGIVAITVVLMGIGAQSVIGVAEKSREVPVLYDLPEFTFVDQDGAPFSLEQMKGKISIVDFFFTSCRGPCPVMVVRFGELYKEFAHSEDIRLVSITVDPDVDSLPRLREYAATHGVTDNRWIFVRGEMADVRKLCADGFKVSDDLPGMHSTKFVLVDAAGKIRGYYDYDDQAALDRLRRDVATLTGAME